MLEDIAILTGGQVISEDLGIKLENVTLDMLGAPSACASTRRTPRSSTAPARRPTSGRVAQIKAQIEETTSDYDRRSCRSVWPSWPAALR
jgi:chaperonin GroEL